MHAARRSAGRAARQLQSRQPQRRFESHGAHDHHHGSASAGPANEGISYKFWLGLGIFPVSYFVYNASRSTEGGKLPSFTQTIQKWTTAEEDTSKRRNTLHTAAIEQAAHDRHLFNGVEGSKKIEMGFPEVFNTGSPINVPAGHYANIDKVVEHYKKENAAQAEVINSRLSDEKRAS